MSAQTRGHCPLCRGSVCAGHINMRDPLLNSPGSDNGGLGASVMYTAHPRAPYGFVTDKQRARAIRREAQEKAIAHKQAQREAAKAKKHPDMHWA